MMSLVLKKNYLQVINDISFLQIHQLTESELTMSKQSGTTNNGKQVKNSSLISRLVIFLTSKFGSLESLLLQNDMFPGKFSAWVLYYDMYK